ncbi:hypothetical protein PUNSTDRAFT_82728 [Punctularia strigosozonata HHB-11173 SS5]|uniref:uncharacterized protein n=1 Tax=Punctularia strigosozonata (strain HHB-11173) TaxID=741275 RepID=UPI0004417ED1|nr:uncharacterized protein PUNSTDRAFT_82728 [Punctularia strigosozonata HHB-11173 SS5]EIN11178.1 hypothetical protein PUNSTDRAFT_82728 [Punctularia strigosozonata HHB-11173 SS5]
MFPVDELNHPGQLLLITDELPSPADFILHRLVAYHLKKSGTESTCILVTTSDDASRWTHVGAKTHLDARSLVNIDLLSYTKPNASLRPLFNDIKRGLESPSAVGKPSLIIVDDIAVMEWIGFPYVEIARFIRALTALCRQENAGLVIRYHVTTPGEPDDLFRQLLQISAYHVDVRPLSSGRSGTVSGEIAIHAGVSCPPTSSVKLISRLTATQYRLTDSGATFFDKGTSTGVL